MNINTMHKTRGEKKSNIRFLKFQEVSYWRDLSWRIIRGLLICGMIYVLLYPLFYMISTSTKSYGDMIDPTCIWIAKSPVLLDNYRRAFLSLDFLNALKNSFVLSMLTAFFQTLLCSVVGYGFARFQFPLKKLWFALVILVLIVPSQLLLLPLFRFYQNFDILGIIKLFNNGSGISILNSYLPFILPTLFGLGLKSSLFIYIFRQFYSGIPVELEDAALIDGCGSFRTYLTIMIPNAKPAIITVFLFSFVWHWNDVIEPSVFITSSPQLYTLGMKLTKVGELVAKTAFSDPSVVQPIKMAAAVLVIIPMILLYAFGQKYFVESVNRTGIVG